METDGWCVPALAYWFSTHHSHLSVETTNLLRCDKRKSVFFISFNCHILKSFSIFFFFFWAAAPLLPFAFVDFVAFVVALLFGPGLDHKLHPGGRSSRNSMKVLTARTDVSYLRDYKTGYAGCFCAFRVFLFFMNIMFFSNPVSPCN